MGGMYFSDKLLFSKGNTLIPVEVAAQDRRRRQPLPRKTRKTRSRKRKSNMNKNKRSIVVKATKSSGNINAININIGDKEKRSEAIAPPRNFSQSFAPTIYQAPQVREGDGRGGFVLNETMGDRNKRRERERREPSKEERRENDDFNDDLFARINKLRQSDDDTPQRGREQVGTIVKGQLGKRGGERLWGFGGAQPSLFDLTDDPINIATSESATQTMGTAASTAQRQALEKVRAEQQRRDFEQSRKEQHRRDEITRQQQAILIELQSKVRQRNALLEASTKRDERHESSGSDDFDTPPRQRTRARGSPLAATTDSSVTNFRRTLVANQSEHASWSSMHGSPRSSPGPGTFRTRG